MTEDDDANRQDTPGGLPPERVEDRPNVGTVKPDDYPDAAENAPEGAGSGAKSPPGLDEEMEAERRNPGNAGATPGGTDDGHRHGGEA